MPRLIPQESRIRAIAAIHALAGGAVVVAAIVWLFIAARHTHGPSDLSAAAIPIIAGAEVIAGLLAMALAGLLWIYHPLGKWLTVLLFAVAAPFSIYFFLHYSIDFITREWTTWRRGEPSALTHYLAGALIEVLIVIWGTLVLVTLLRPSSRPLFSRDYRNSLRAERATPIQPYTSPYFAVGLVVWSIIGCAIAVL